MGEGKYAEAAELFDALAEQGYSDSRAQAEACRQAIADAEAARLAALQADYEEANGLAAQGELEEALALFKLLAEQEYSDSGARATALQEQIDEREYEAAMALLETDEDAGMAALEELKDYPKAKTTLHERKYAKAAALQEAGRYEEAAEAFGNLTGYSDSVLRQRQCRYSLAMEKLEKGDYDGARTLLRSLGSYEDAAEQLEQIKYRIGYDTAQAWEEAGSFARACLAYEALGDFRDSEECYRRCLLRSQGKDSLVVNGMMAVQTPAGLYTLQEDGSFKSEAGSSKLGYMDLEGNLVIPCIYDAANHFSAEGLASVYSKTDGYFIIDRQGNRLQKMSDQTEFSEGVARVSSGFIDTELNVVIKSYRDYTEFLDEKGQWKKVKTGLYFSTSFVSGVAVAHDYGYQKQFLVSRSGKILYTFKDGERLESDFVQGVAVIRSIKKG